jgi:hypothetical protein
MRVATTGLRRAHVLRRHEARPTLAVFAAAPTPLRAHIDLAATLRCVMGTTEVRMGGSR